MKKIIFLSMAFFLLSTFEVSAIKIKIKGSGGVQSDGKNHKVCPDASQEVCATIEVNWSDIKDLVKGGTTTFNNVDVSTNGRNPKIIRKVNCELKGIREVNNSEVNNSEVNNRRLKEIFVSAKEVTILRQPK